MSDRPLQGEPYKHTVAMFDSAGDPVTGVTASDVSVTFQKPESTSSTNKTISSSDFNEIDANNMPGLYDLHFTSSEMDVAGEMVGSVTPSGGTSLDIKQYNFRFTIEDITNEELKNQIQSIEVSGDSSNDFAQSQSVQIKNFPEHFVAKVKKDTQYTWDFKIVDPSGFPIKGVTSSDISVTVLSSGGPNATAGSPQVLSSTIDTTLTEINQLNAPGWYSLTLEPSDTVNLGDLDVEINLENFDTERNGAEIQDTPTNYENLLSIYMRDLDEGFFVTQRSGSNAAGQVIQTSDGGQNWNVSLKVGEASPNYDLEGCYDIDGVDPNNDQFAALSLIERKITSGGRTIALPYDYGHGIGIRNLVFNESTESNFNIVQPISLSELDQRSWYAYLSVDTQNNNQSYYTIKAWNRFNAKNNTLKSESDKEYSDIYALDQQENAPQSQVLQQSQDVTEQAAVYSDSAAGFTRVVFEDNTTGELVYIDNEGGSWGPRSIIDDVDNPGHPTIAAHSTGTSSPVLTVAYEKKAVNEIIIAQYLFNTGTSVDDNEWTLSNISNTNTDFKWPDSDFDENNNYHLTYVDDSQFTIRHVTDRTGSFVYSNVWVSSGIPKAFYPSISLDRNNQDGFVSIFSSIATDGTNTDEVRTFEEPDPAADGWADTIIDSESSVSEDEYSRQVDVTANGTILPPIEFTTPYAFVKKNQNTSDDPEVYSSDKSSNLVKIADLNAFTHFINVGREPFNLGYKKFYLQDDGVPTLIHQTFDASSPNDINWRKRTVDPNTDIQTPIGGYEMMSTNFSAGNESVVQFLGIDNSGGATAGDLIDTFSDEGNRAKSVSFENDLVAFGGGDNNVYVRDITDGSLVHTFTDAGDNVNGISIDGGIVAFGSKDGNVYVRDLSDGSLVQTFNTSGIVDDVDISGDLVIIGSNALGQFDTIVKDITDGSTVYSFNNTPIHRVAISASYIAHGRFDVTVKDVSDGSVINTFNDSNDELTDIDIDGDLVAFGGQDHNVYVRNIPNGTLEQTLTDASSDVRAVSFEEDVVAYGSQDGPVWVRDVTDGSLLHEFTDASSQVDGVSIDENKVAYGGVDTTVWVRNIFVNKKDLYLYDFDINQDDDVVIGGQDTSTSPNEAIIEKTTDGGVNWSPSTTPSIEASIRRFDFADQSEGYAVTNQGHVLKTTDGGDTWSQVNQLSNISLRGVWNPKPDTVSVVGRDNNSEGPAHYESTDGGSTFNRFNPTESVAKSPEFNSIDGDNSDPSECWITGVDGEVVHCFKTVTFSGDRKFRFQVVEYYESDTYGLVDQVKGTVDEIQTNVDTVETKIDDIDTRTTEILNRVKRILGLQGENYRAKNYTFDPETGKLTSVDWVLYSNATDAQNDQNPIAEYSIDITLDANGEPSSYVATRTA